MVDRRIRISKGQDDLVTSLVRSEQSTGPFSLKADVLAFAAALGAHRDWDKELGETTRDHIRYEVFERQGYGPLINLLSVKKAGNATVLADAEDMEKLRISTFEEYACGGLEIIRNELKGATDYLEAILLLIVEAQGAEPKEPTEFDLREFLE